MVRQSIIILALLNEFVYEYRGNNTCVIQEKTALRALAPPWQHLCKTLSLSSRVSRLTSLGCFLFKETSMGDIMLGR